MSNWKPRTGAWAATNEKAGAATVLGSSSDPPEIGRTEPHRGADAPAIQLPTECGPPWQRPLPAAH